MQSAVASPPEAPVAEVRAHPRPIAVPAIEASGSTRAATSTRLYILPILAAALVARLAVILIVAWDDPRKWLFDQATELSALAQSLLAGHGLSSPFGGATGPSAFLTPGYPAVIATLFKIFGVGTTASAIAIMLLQALFGMATVLVIMHVARRVFGTRTANLAGAIWALSPALLWLPTFYWESSLSILFLISVIALALRCVDQPSISRWSAIGLASGVALLVNPSLSLALTAIFFWTLWSTHKSRLFARSGPLTAILLGAMIFAPWPIRNLYTMHAFIPARTNMGYELWQGNGPQSKGFFAPLLHPNINQTEFNRYASLGEIAYMQEKSILAQHAIHADPARFVRLTFKRFLCYWTGFTDRPSSSFVIAHIIFTTLFAGAGLVMLIRRRSAVALLFLLPLLVFPIPYYITHPDFRFRLVLDPIATILTAYALLNFKGLASTRSDTA